MFAIQRSFQDKDSVAIQDFVLIRTVFSASLKKNRAFLVPCNSLNSKGIKSKLFSVDIELSIFRSN